MNLAFNLLVGPFLWSLSPFSSTSALFSSLVRLGLGSCDFLNNPFIPAVNSFIFKFCFKIYSYIKFNLVQHFVAISTMCKTLVFNTSTICCRTRYNTVYFNVFLNIK